jgi:hypothetical protein
MKHLLRAGALLLLVGLALPGFAADNKADKADATAKDDGAKKDDKAAKGDAAKKDDKDAKGDAAKKDDKADAAKKDDAKKGDAEKKEDAKKDAAKKDDAKKSSAKKAEKKDERVNTEKSIAAGQLTGKVVSVGSSKRTIRLSVAVAVPKLDLTAVNSAATYRLAAQQALVQYQQLATQAQQAMTQAQQAAAKKDRNGYNQAMTQASQYQAQAAQYQATASQQNILASRLEANPYRNETKYEEVEIAAIDEVKVRRQSPEDQFDERGKKKRLTAAQLKEAKGDDPKQPGYQADFTSLREEQIVTVTLVKNKDAPKLRPEAKKDRDAGLLGDNMPKASMIMIVADSPPVK